MPRDARKYLFDIGEASKLISQFVAGKTLDDSEHSAEPLASLHRARRLGDKIGLQ